MPVFYVVLLPKLDTEKRERRDGEDRERERETEKNTIELDCLWDDGTMSPLRAKITHPVLICVGKTDTQTQTSTEGYYRRSCANLEANQAPRILETNITGSEVPFSSPHPGVTPIPGHFGY